MAAFLQSSYLRTAVWLGGSAELATRVGTRTDVAIEVRESLWSKARDCTRPASRAWNDAHISARISFLLLSITRWGLRLQPASSICLSECCSALSLPARPRRSARCLLSATHFGYGGWSSAAEPAGCGRPSICSQLDWAGSGSILRGNSFDWRALPPPFRKHHFENTPKLCLGKSRC